MVRKVFGVYDSKAGVFLTPFFFSATGEAVRFFQDGVNEPGTSVNKHPEDYRLAFLGEFNDNTGKFESVETPEWLGYGTDYVSKDEVAKRFPVVSPIPPQGKKAS